MSLRGHRTNSTETFAPTRRRHASDPVS